VQLNWCGGCCRRVNEAGNELPDLMKGLSLFELLSKYRFIEKGIRLMASCQSVTSPFVILLPERDQSLVILLPERNQSLCNFLTRA
jgi:hypothetical protein